MVEKAVFRDCSLSHGWEGCILWLCPIPWFRRLCSVIVAYPKLEAVFRNCSLSHNLDSHAWEGYVPWLWLHHTTEGYVSWLWLFPCLGRLCPVIVTYTMLEKTMFHDCGFSLAWEGCVFVIVDQIMLEKAVFLDCGLSHAWDSCFPWLWFIPCFRRVFYVSVAYPMLEAVFRDCGLSHNWDSHAWESYIPWLWLHHAIEGYVSWLWFSPCLRRVCTVIVTYPMLEKTMFHDCGFSRAWEGCVSWLWIKSCSRRPCS